ncbi:hypothetical protein LCGC14_2122520, partial [marine sediment metagenome]
CCTLKTALDIMSLLDDDFLLYYFTYLIKCGLMFSRYVKV